MLSCMDIHRYIYVIYFINSFIGFLLDVSILVYYLVKIWPPSSCPLPGCQEGLCPEAGIFSYFL